MPGVVGLFLNPTGRYDLLGFHHACGYPPRCDINLIVPLTADWGSTDVTSAHCTGVEKTEGCGRCVENPRKVVVGVLLRRLTTVGWREPSPDAIVLPQVNVNNDRNGVVEARGGDTRFVLGV
jgi:hypothetical protein